MKIQILKIASNEIDTAVDYYNQELSGLGYELALAFQVALELIDEFPQAWPKFDDEIRRYRLSRFPYGILYEAKGCNLIIVGFMHLSMNPKSWKTSLSKRVK